MESPESTQVSDSESSRDSFEIELTAPLSVPDSPSIHSTPPLPGEDETQVLQEDEDFDQETQVLEDLDFDELGTTQVLDSEDEGTQLLTDDDGGSVGRFEDTMELVDGNETQVLDDLNVEKCDSESLYTSGLAVIYKTNAKGTDHEAGYIQGNSQSEKEVAHQGSEVSGTKGPASSEMQGRETISNHCIQNGNGVTGRRDVSKCRVAKPTVRKLFSELTPENDTSLLEFENYSQEHAGLSYVLSQPSQEPGEILNALNVVDKLISLNKEDSPQQRDWGSARKERSPLVSSAKGTKTLALKLRNTVREAGIFDWDDNREDGGGGYFFSKRKEELLGGVCHARGSYTQPKNQRPRNAKKGRNTMDRLEKEDDDLSLCQKLKCLTRSDSRLVMDKFNKDEKKQHICTRARKNLSKGLNAMRNMGTSSGKLEETGIIDGHDVGIEKMASEAIEALDCGGTHNHSNGVVYQDTTNVTKSCKGDEMKKVNSKRASRCRSFTPGGTLRRSGRINKLDTNLSTETPCMIFAEENITGIGPGSKTKGEERVMNAIKKLDTSTAAIENTATDRRSSKSTKGVNSVSAVNKTNLKEADRLYRSSTSNGNISAGKQQIQEDYRIVTPVHPRSRKSFSVKSSKSSGLCSDTGDGTGEMKARETKEGQRGPNVDESHRGQRCKLISDLIGSVTKDKSIQQQPTNYILHEEISNTSYEKKGICRYPLRKRAHQNMVNDINGFANADIQSTGQDIESNEQSMRKKKKPKTDVRNTSVKIDHKRITRSSVQASVVSPDKKCDRNLTRQSVPTSALNVTSINRSSPVMNAKVVLENKDELYTYSSKECVEGCVSNIEQDVKNGRSDMSPAARVRRSSTTCFTPISNCTTPIKVASPVITSDGHTNRFGKNHLSRSLTRAVKNLDANEIIQNPTSKDLRRKKDMANVRVLFSGHLGEDIIRQQKKILLRLGASVACSSAEATHFVTDNFLRTRNMLESIASGKPIVTRLWLESCGQARCFIDEKNYILRDFKKEKEIGFSLPISLARATQSPLLEGKRVYITENVNPSKELIACLVKAVRGQVVERIGRSTTRDNKVPDDLLILSSEGDYEICVPLIEKGAVIYNSDILLNGIVIQKLEYERHHLFTDHVRKTRSTTWLRKRDGDQFVPVAKHN